MECCSCHCQCVAATCAAHHQAPYLTLRLALLLQGNEVPEPGDQGPHERKLV